MRFSGTTQCFYPEDVDYPSLPADVVTVAQTDYDLAMARASRETLNVVNGKIVIVPAPAPTLAEAWKAYQTQAQAALDASDVTVLRCVEKAIVVPTEWATYRASLRAIVGATTLGDPTQPLPTKPAYPAGT